MDAVTLRPRLASFRVVSFSEKNDLEPASEKIALKLEMKPTIGLDLRLPVEDGHPIQAFVTIRLSGRAVLDDKPDEEVGQFEAHYEGRFVYSDNITEAEITPEFGREPYQYMLVAQAFPLAASHFRRELLAMGFDARELPLGL